MTKSMRRRLARKAKQAGNALVVVQPAVQQAQQVAVIRPPGQGTSKSARRRRRNRGRGFSGFGGGENLYLSSLLDPENGAGAKVPDMVTFPSGTFQLSFDQTLTPTGTGDGIAAWFCPFIGDAAAVWPIKTGTNAAAGADYTWTNRNWVARASIVNAYDSVRPVSAVLYAEFIGASSTDNGQICMGIIPRISVNPTTTVQNFNTGIAQSFTKTIPLRNGAKVLWKPQDNQDQEYFATALAGVLNSNPYPPQIFIATSGMATTTTIRIRCVANYEGIPTADTYSIIAATPSPANLQHLQEASNFWGSAMYDNMSAFVDTVGPYVRPVLSQASAGLSNYAASRVANYFGNSSRRGAGIGNQMSTRLLL